MTDTATYVSNFEITLDGASIPPDMAGDIFEVTVENSLHLPDLATIVIQDPRLKWIDSSSIEPGAEVVISAGFDREREQIFAGEIVELEPVFADGTLHLVIRAFDKLHRLSRGRSVRSFINVTDGDVIQKIAQEVGLRAKVGPTSMVHPYLIQAGLTNLEFLQQRATGLGYLLYVDGDTLVCEEPKASDAALSLKMFVDLIEFRPRMTTVGQLNEVIVRGWDPASKRTVIGKAKDGTVRPKIGISSSGGAMAQKAYNLQASYVVSNRPLSDQQSANLLARSLANRHDSQFVEAEATSLGHAKLMAGSAVKIEHVGERFGGTYFVTTSTHRFDLVSGYTTSFTVSGSRPDNLLSLLAADDPQTAAAASNNLMVAIVTDNQDPEGLGRVKVKYPMLSDEHASHWARVLVLDGGNNRGFQFIPEVNDEVLVGFVLGDINHPYVLGGLWNGRDKPPLSASDAIQGGKVVKRTIHSRTGHYILFDDDDAGGGISIVDKQGNTIVLKAQDNSLTITTTGDVSLTTKGNLTMDVTGNAAFKAKGNITLEATGSLALKATGQAELNGTGGAKVTSSAIVDVKGSMINLN